MQTITHDRASQALEQVARDGILPFQVTVEFFDQSLGEWIADARGASVPWLAAAADDVADFGRVRLVSEFGTVLA